LTLPIIPIAVSANLSTLWISIGELLELQKEILFINI
jgi:hypothetical protein